MQFSKDNMNSFASRKHFYFNEDFLFQYRWGNGAGQPSDHNAAEDWFIRIKVKLILFEKPCLNIFPSSHGGLL